MDILNKAQEQAGFTERLKEILNLRGHSSKSFGELKELFDCSRTSAFSWLNAKRLPSSQRGLFLCDVLDCSYLWLMTGRGTIEGFEMKTSDEVALIEQYRNLTSHGQRMLMSSAFTDCNDHEIKPTRKSDKQSALKLVTKRRL